MIERGQAFIACCLIAVTLLTLGLLIFQHSQPAR